MVDQDFEEKIEREIEKHIEEIGHRDRLSSISWSAILIWTGFVFLGVNLGWVNKYLNRAFIVRLLPKNMVIFEPSVWGVITLGAGVILLLEAVVRFILPGLSRRISGSLIIGAVFIAIGLSSFFGWDMVWPLLVIAVGASILIGGLSRQ